MERIRLSNLERVSNGFTDLIKLTHADLTEATANTAQTIEIANVRAGSVVKNAAVVLKTAFKDASDAAFNTTAITVGDDGDTDRLIASMELNENGTEVTYKVNPAANLPYAFTASNTLDVVFGSMSAKSLSDIDTGEVWIFLEIYELANLAFG